MLLNWQFTISYQWPFLSQYFQYKLNYVTICCCQGNKIGIFCKPLYDVINNIKPLNRNRQRDTPSLDWLYCLYYTMLTGYINFIKGSTLIIGNAIKKYISTVIQTIILYLFIASFKIFTRITTHNKSTYYLIFCTFLFANPMDLL